MLNPELIEAADQLWFAAERRQPCLPVRDAIAHASAGGADPIAQAYAIQQYNTERALRAGRRLVGRKIGLTAKSVQRQLGVDQPDFGMLFADMARQDGEDIDCADVLQPKVEAEVALVLERDLPHEVNTVADVIRATAFALPAIEIVGSRVAGWDIRLTDTIADNASSSLFVLGTRPVSLGALDLANCGMSMELNGDPVSVGAGAACLGNPLNAAVWLANTMSRVGAPLKAGDVILTGALGPMATVQPGNVFTARIEGLGAVTAAFRADSKQGDA